MIIFIFINILLPLEYINKKLVFLIQSLSKKEINQFRKFISSPFFTQGRNYMPFLDEVIETTGKFRKNIKTNESKTNKENNAQTLRNRYWELYKLAEDFLIYKDLKENVVERNKILLKNLVDKKIYSSFNSRIKETFKHLSKEKFTINKHQDISYISNLNLVFLNDINKSDYYYKDYFDNSKNNFCLSLLSHFEMGLEFIHQEKINIKFGPNNILDFLKKLEITEMMKRFAISDSIIEKVTSMYYYLYKAFEIEENEFYFYRSHEIFSESLNELKDTFKIETYIHMINYCIYKQNKGVFRYRRELFKLYNEKLEQGLISDFKNDLYLFNNFRDYVFIGISIKEYEWVKDFIVKYSIELPAEIRDCETGLSFARLNFAKNKFVESLSYLNDLNTSNYIYYIDSSILKLCNYYELRNYEEAFLELDKINHYLRNHSEIPEILRIHTANFTKFYKKILKLMTVNRITNTGSLKK